MQNNNTFNRTGELLIQRNQQIVYPVLNIVCNPRFSQQKIHDGKIPLSKYTEKIYACNRKKAYQSNYVNPNFLKKFGREDGMIYNMREMRVGISHISKNQDQQMGINQIKANSIDNIRLDNSQIADNKVGALKILICVCMYNESRDALNLTLEGIYENLQQFQKQGISPGEIAVVLIQDGILKLVADRSQRTYAKGKKSMVQFYAQMDKCQNKPKCDLKQRINVIIDQINNFQRQSQAHLTAKNSDFPISIEKNVSLLYQNLWYPSKTRTPKIEENNSFPQKKAAEKHRLRIFSCFKHTNGTKLSSHLWFFQGFCRYIKPHYCVLLDVGTKPDKNGVINLIKGFKDQQVGGLTGFLTVDANFPSQQGDTQDAKLSCVEDAFFSIQKAQQYQYVISHFLDKNAQGALGFLHVLPGAWSAYRYKALIKTQKYEPTLLQKSYFKMILNPSFQDKDYRQANMYLAEDRILSLGIYCQFDCNYILKYIPNAIAYTDPMKTHKDLMVQRRRWINSSLFAFLYVFRNYFYNLTESKHNFFRRYITINISMIIALLSFFNTYITPSIYVFVLYATILQINGYGTFTQQLAKAVSFIYVITFLSSVGGGLMGRGWTQKAHIVSYILSLFTFALLGLVAYNIIQVYLNLSSGQLDFSNFIIASLVVMLVLNISLSFITIGMHICTHPKFVWRLIVDSFSYLVYNGAYSQVMVAHSFCNIDDVSWGTKGSTADGKKKYQIDKVFFVSQWLFYNAVLAAIFIYVDIVIPARTVTGNGAVLIGIAIYGSAVFLIKSIFAIWYHIKWILGIGDCCAPQNRDNKSIQVNKYWKSHQQWWLKASKQNINKFNSMIYRPR